MRLFPRIRLRKVVLFSILLALLIHAGFFGLLNLSDYTPEARVEPSMVVSLNQVTQNKGESPTVDERELDLRMDRGVQRLQTVSREQNLKTLETNSRWLDKYSSEKGVSDISVIVRRAANAPERAYVPAEKPPAGEFDMKSMLPYATAKVVGQDGLERTEQTWIDKEGRSMRQTSRKQTTAEGVAEYFHGVYQPDGTLYEFKTDKDPLDGNVNSALNIVAKSPLLQKLYQDAVLPILEAKRNKSKPKP